MEEGKTIICDYTEDVFFSNLRLILLDMKSFISFQSIAFIDDLVHIF